MPSTFARILLVLVPALAGAQTDSGPWRFVDPGAKTVISVDWKRVSHSELAVMLRQTWLGPAAGGTLPGIEFLDDVDRFLAASPGGDPSNPDTEAPLLVVAIGHFDLARVRAVLLANKTRPQQFNSFVVYRQQGKNAKDLAFALFDKQTILIGDAHSVFAGLDRSAFQHAPPEPGSILARAPEMDASYDGWAIVNAPGAPASNRLADLLSGIGVEAEAQGFEAGISLRTGLAADITVLFPSEEEAKNVTGQLTKIIHLAARDKSGEAFLQDFERKMKLTADGPRVRITLRLTPQEFDKNTRLFASRKRTPAAAAEVRPVATPAPAPAPPPPPEKQVIRIEGLDDGIREIPLQQH